jgi:hypothetical protein
MLFKETWRAQMHSVGKIRITSKQMNTEPLGFKGLNEQKEAEQGES